MISERGRGGFIVSAWGGRRARQISFRWRVGAVGMSDKRKQPLRISTGGRGKPYMVRHVRRETNLAIAKRRLEEEGGWVVRRRGVVAQM